MGEHPRIEELRRRVQTDPASIAFAALAEEYRRAGMYEEAIATCTVGLKRHPAYLSAHVTLGRALIEVGRYDEARQELELVLSMAPENLAAIRALAEIHDRAPESPYLESAPEVEQPPPPPPIEAAHLFAKPSVPAPGAQPVWQVPAPVTMPDPTPHAPIVTNSAGFAMPAAPEPDIPEVPIDLEAALPEFAEALPEAPAALPDTRAALPEPAATVPEPAAEPDPGIAAVAARIQALEAFLANIERARQAPGSPGER